MMERWEIYPELFVTESFCTHPTADHLMMVGPLAWILATGSTLYGLLKGYGSCFTTCSCFNPWLKSNDYDKFE